jgi:DNA-binding NtrC family response regulator/DNA-binding GntR family transcriptional regulator
MSADPLVLEKQKGSGLAPVQRKSLRQTVAQGIYSAILRGELNAGERVTELGLANRLAVSQPTIREALLELEKQGFIERKFPGKTFVTVLTRRDISEIYEVRTGLEVGGVRLIIASGAKDLQAAEKAYQTMIESERAGQVLEFVLADLDFHRGLWEASGNRQLATALEVVVPKLFAFVIIGRFQRSPADMALDIEMHGRVLRLIRDLHEREAVALLEESMQLGLIEGCRFAQDGRDYWLTCHPVHLSSKRVGGVVVLDSSKGRSGRRPENASVKYSFEDLIGKSPAFLDSLSVARIAAQNDLPVLISGESGTGKEMIAESIHQASSRFSGPFVAVNCAAIPSELICSELFGYAEGAYTGAKRSGNIGKFEAADGGTLFLDEVSDLSPNAQAALLRVLQEMEITRLGSHRLIQLDVRIIAATNADLYRMVEKKNFRSDLLHRLNVLSLTVPSLRERREDMELLAEAFLKIACIQLRKAALRFDGGVINYFLQYAWPGNVRELKNVIQRAAALASGQLITLKELPAHLIAAAAASKPASSNEAATSIQAQEKRMILESLAVCRGNFSLAASQLGLGRTTLYRKLKKHGIRRWWKPD